MPAIALILLLCVLAHPAAARKLDRAAPIVREDPARPFIFGQNPFSGATSVRVTMKRERKVRVLR